MGAKRLAGALAADLRRWHVPAVKSEKELDEAVREFIRGRIRKRLGVPELKQWVAGHGEPEPLSRFWRKSKPYQVIDLWGAGKTSDLFVYHPKGRYGLPKAEADGDRGQTGGISFEIKYVAPNKSYAHAIPTAAGQLLAYSLRHEWTIGFVLVDGPRRSRKTRVDRSQDFLRCLPPNATLIVRFRES